MRLLTVVLAVLLVLIQYPLWFGKGGWLRVWELDRQVNAANKKNEDLKERSATLQSEVRDLKEGTEAIEENARYKLGMIKQKETFVRIVESAPKPASAPSK